MTKQPKSNGQPVRQQEAVHTFSPRVIAILLIILFIFMAWIFFWLLYAQRSALLRGRKESLVQQLSLTLSVCRQYDSRIGEDLTRYDAMAEAATIISNLRYGQQQSSYFYIIDSQGALLMHPHYPEDTGRDLTAETDELGQPVFSNIVDLCKVQSAGFLEYDWYWDKQIQDEAGRTAAFAQFVPWDWVIITDASNTDINEAVTRELWRETGVLLIIVIALAFVLVITLRRLVLSGVDRLIELVNRLHLGDYSARIELSPMDEMSDVTQAVNEMAENVERRDEQIRLTQRASVFALAKLTEARDNETGGHLLRVREFAKVLAFELRDKPGWNDIINSAFIADLYDAVMLHDIGKVGVPDSILLKPDVLDEAERALMMSHTLIGARTINAARRQMGADSTFLRMAEQIARSHHERWDGSGYAEMLSGEEIPPASRIFTVADVYDALTTERPYKPAFPHKEAVRIMTEERGQHYDPSVLDTFLSIQAEFNRIRQEFADDPADRGQGILRQPGGYYAHWGEDRQSAGGE